MDEFKNDMNDLNSEKLDKNWIDLISKNWGKYCSSCGAKKDMSKMKVFRKVGPVTQVVSECESCGLKTLITAIPNIGMHINQIRTDLQDPSEFERLSSPLTSHDYLNFYNEIKDIRSSSDLIKVISNI